MEDEEKQNKYLDKMKMEMKIKMKMYMKISMKMKMKIRALCRRKLTSSIPGSGISQARTTIFTRVCRNRQQTDIFFFTNKTTFLCGLCA